MNKDAPSEKNLSDKAVLIVDDKESVRNMITAHLSGLGYDTTTAETGEAALDMFKERIFDVVITDMRMPGMSGLDVIRAVKDISPDTVVVVMTAFGDMDNAIEAMKEGAYDYLKKPFKLDEIEAALARALQTACMRRENRFLREAVQREYSFSRIIAKSRQMRKLFSILERVAATDSSVLILGETGVGKELVARALHFNSMRKSKPFVVVDCAAIPSTLLESELFGYVRGAFTGAMTNKKGLFEIAHTGTLFMDEIGELDPALQGKLLRALEDGSVSRIGDTNTMKVDVRLIAATNRDLEKEVEAGRFRRDLYFRVNVVPIRIPALRERKEDIPLLTRHFADSIAAENNKQVKTFQPDALNALINYSWPGNVRELRNVVERSILLTDGETVTAADLPVEVIRGAAEAAGGADFDFRDDGLSLKEQLARAVAQIERSAIKKALEESGNSRLAAANLLGISRRALFYKLKEYGL